jgi:glucokinase-like ROK family protein
MSQRPDLRTGDQALVREINLSVIMRHLREHAPISRAALAEMTGLNKTTVSSLVTELTERQFVHEVGLDSSGIGRPAMLLELNPEAGCIVSAEIGVDFISVIRTDFAPEIIWQHKESIDSKVGHRTIIDRAIALLDEAIDSRSASDGNLLGMAVGVPGLIDQADLTVLFAPNLGWRDVKLGRVLREAFDVPVFVDNEANMAALGEYYFGAAQGRDEILYISAGVGLGGGIVRSGALVKGKTGCAGEFGHMTMDPEGELCSCGNRGCWETLVSQSAVFRHIRQAIEQGQTSVLSEMTEGDLKRLTIPMVVDAARQGDQVALQVLDRVGHDLGIGVASLLNALNPDLVVFGGILSLAADFLLPPMEIELEQRALDWNRTATRVVPARHGCDACVMGGVATIYQTILAQPGNAERVFG